MAQTKDFSILKWLVFPSLTLALGAIIAYFNIRVFGWQDGSPYVAIVVVLVAFSIAINRYISSENLALARAAFVLEIILILALAINASYSFSVQRNMSVARKSETVRSEDLKTISTLKSRTAQRDATRMIASKADQSKSADAIFAENERPLFWIMVAELMAYIISAFTLLGLSHLWTPQTKQSRQPALTEREKEISRRVLATRKPYRVRSEQEIAAEYDRQSALYDQFEPRDEAILCDNCGFKKAYRIPGRKSTDPDIAAIEARFPVEAEAFRTDKRNLCGDCYFNCLYEMRDDWELPTEIDTNIREEPEKPRLRQQPQKSDIRRQSPSVALFDRREALKKLREHLKTISFQNPGLWFKSDLFGEGVTIRLYRRIEGREELVASTTQSNKLLQSVDRPDFRQRLIEELIFQGFPIEQGRSH